MVKRKGHYFGTEIDEKWWKRYKKDKLFARGTGEYWYDSRSFYFRRYLTKSILAFNFKDIKEIRTGKWHAGQWGAGRTVVKFIWEKDGLKLSSGFLLSKDETETLNIIEDINNYKKPDK